MNAHRKPKAHRSAAARLATLTGSLALVLSVGGVAAAAAGDTWSGNVTVTGGTQVAYTGAINGFPTVYGWNNSQFSITLTDQATSATYVIKATGVMANDGGNTTPVSATFFNIFDFRGTANLYNSTGKLICGHGGIGMGGEWLGHAMGTFSFASCPVFSLPQYFGINEISSGGGSVQVYAKLVQR